jgi:uncharacterized membrane protein
MKIYIDIIGWLGSVCIILAYWMISSGKADNKSFRYQLLNICGSIFLIANTIYYGAMPPAALNAMWLIIGLYSIIRYKKKHSD